MRAARRAAVWLGLGVLLLSTAWFVTVPFRYATSVWAVEGKWASDHTSHFCTALLWLRHPIDIYRKPSKELCAPVGPRGEAMRAELTGAVPSEICRPDSSPGRPLFVNWNYLPRAYPPGAYLYAAPEALLYFFTDLSIKLINQLSVAKFVVVAHLAVLFAALMLFGPRRQDPADAASPAMSVLFLGLVYYECIRWALTGFYDGISLTAFFVATWLSLRGKPLEAFLAAAVALFTHFRILWMLPAICWLGVRAVGEARTRRFDRRAKVLLGLSGGLVAWSALCFVLVYPHLKDFPHTNPVAWANWNFRDGRILGLALVTALVLLDALAAANFLFASTVVWALFVLVRTPQVQGWHSLAALGLLAVAQLSPGRARATLGAGAIYVAELITVFGDDPLPGSWIVDLVKHNI